MEARDIMSKEVITLAPDLRIGEATDLLLEYRIHGAPVVMPDAQLIGMISFMDLPRRAGEDATVRDVMSSDPVVAYEDTPADEVARIMLDACRSSAVGTSWGLSAPATSSSCS